MITRNKKRIYFISTLCLLLLFAFSLLAINKYLSNVILAGPFHVKIEGVSLEKANPISIYGYSPFGKVQQLCKINNGSTWDYDTYSNFKTLVICASDSSLEKIKQISIITHYKRIEIKEIKKSIFNKRIDLSGFLHGKTSKMEIIFSMFHWSDIRFFQYIILIFSVVIIFFIARRKFFKNKTIIFSGKILLLIFFAGLALHILFHILTKEYLITSGVFLIILISLFVYYIFHILERLSKFRFKMKEIWLSITSIAICLTIIEISLFLSGYKNTSLEKGNRYFYSSPYNIDNNCWFYIQPKDHYLKSGEFSFFRTINAEGLSDIKHPVIKNDNEYRICGLGDSFTEGAGTDADSTWLKFLERSMLKSSIKRQLTFINGGVAGSDPFFEYVLLKDRLLKYKPDLVLLALNNSDIYDVLIRGGMERFKPDGTVKYNTPPWWEPIYATIHISRLFFAAFGYNELLIKEKEDNFIEPKEKIIQIIHDFNELSLQNNFKLVIIFHPLIKEVEDAKMELDDVMKKVKSIKGVDVLDMLKYFKEKENIDPSNCLDYYWKHDGHHNAKGYEAFARGVEWKLKENGILDSLKIN